MTVDAFIFWLFVGAWLVVLALLLFVQLPRIVAQTMRAVRRVLALVNDSPVPLQIAKAEGDVQRVSAALDRLPVLQARVQTSIRVIRSTPRLPPALVAAIGQLRTEARAFRAWSRFSR